MRVEQFQCRLPVKTQLPSEIAKAGFKLFMERYLWRTPVRAVTIRAIELTPHNECEQLSLFTDFARREKLMQLQDAIEAIRGRFGNNAIYNAILMGDKKMPSDRRDLVRMPGLMYQ